MGQRVRLLKDSPYGPSEIARILLKYVFAKYLYFSRHLSSLHVVYKPVYAPEQGALSGAAGAQDREHFLRV